MADSDRPRNIRDIAHLYLSRRTGNARAFRSNIFVVAEHRRCVSGFHAANMAAAMSTLKARVRVFELSGLLPNIPFYFCDSPDVYLRLLVGSPRDFSPGLNGISITFDSVRLMSDQPEDGGVQINLIHLPPVDAMDDYARFLEEFADRCPGDRWAVYLAGNASSDGMGRLFTEALGASATFALSLGGSHEFTRPARAAVRHLGSVGNWHSGVKDRVPVVFRNPKAGLAREYLSICESLLSQINSARRSGDAGQLVGAFRSRSTRP